MDINGIPEKIPGLRYMRFPLIHCEWDSFEHWMMRKGSPATLLEATGTKIKQLELEVQRISWERKLRERPAPSQEVYETNKRVIEILEGEYSELKILMKELRDRAVKAKSSYKASNYAKAIRSIESLASPLRSGQEALALPGIGQKTAEKIQEILDTVN